METVIEALRERRLTERPAWKELALHSKVSHAFSIWRACGIANWRVGGLRSKK